MSGNNDERNVTGSRSTWTNFSIWRGRLPHWRADNVTYYVTFRHRRDLSEDEMNLLWRQFMQRGGAEWDILALAVLPSQTELLIRQESGSGTGRGELSRMVERCKSHAGRKIIAASQERFPPFYNESFDRIVRDHDELMEKLQQMIASVESSGLSLESESYPFLYVKSQSREDPDSA